MRGTPLGFFGKSEGTGELDPATPAMGAGHRELPTLGRLSHIRLSLGVRFEDAEPEANPLLWINRDGTSPASALTETSLDPATAAAAWHALFPQLASYTR